MATASPGRKEQRRLQQQDLGRTQLLDAAEEVFGRRGYHNTTLKEIAELAEFSVGSVYSFFENKDDLFLHIFLRRGMSFLDGLRAVAAHSGSPIERLGRIVDHEVGFFRAHPHFGRLYLRTSTAGSPMPGRDVDGSHAAELAEALAIQAAVIAEGQKEGDFRAGDPDVLSRLLTGMVRAFLAVDPLVVANGGHEGLSLDEFRAIVEAALRR